MENLRLSIIHKLFGESDDDPRPKNHMN